MVSTEKSRLGGLLVQLRENKGLSVNKAAAEIGLSASVLSRFERGGAFPGDEGVAKLSAFYGVSVLELEAEEAIDRQRIDVPPGVSDEDVRAAVYRLAGQAAPETQPVDPQAYECPKCGAKLRCVAS
jgi:transcriptional regulator with XRE-family HTH domain